MAYQRRTSEAFSHLTMGDREMTISENGETIFMGCRGDFISSDGRLYKNIYVFNFTIVNCKIMNFLEYCNPVTYAVLACLPIAAGYERDHL